MPARTYFSVPYERNANFVGREECIEAIDKIFSGPKYASFVALHGFGGIGYESLRFSFTVLMRNEKV